MKKMILFTAMILTITGFAARVNAQSDEVVQLLLNVEKLSQYKQILNDIKTGYQILDKGYSTIKDISQGNFSMHQLFLDGLWAVSPTVMQYGGIADVISNQMQLVKEYKNAFNRFKSTSIFKPDEISYMGAVYDNLFNQSLHNLEYLANIITANKLRMSDDERIKAIDNINADMEDKLRFLRTFNNSTIALAIQRQKAQNEVSASKSIYGIN